MKSLGGTSMRKNLGQFIASVHVSAFCNAAAAATRGQGHDVCGIAGRRNLFAPIAAGLLAFANVCPQAADAAVDQVIDPPAGYLYATPLAISPDSSKVLVLLEDGSGNTVVNLWTANEGFQPLLLPGYPFSTTYRVSNDFSVVVSAGYGNGSSSAFVWSATEGLQAIEPLTGDQTTAWVAVSADGSTVLGKSRTSSVPFTERDFVWTRATGTQEIASPPGCQIQNLLSIADDGSSAVGYMSCSGHSAGVYWSPGTGAQFMPTIPGAPPPFPGRMSADGSTVAFSAIALGIWRIGLWTVGGDVQEIFPPSAESTLQFQASKISTDGSTVVWESFDASGHHVFRWNETDGSESLTLPGISSTGVMAMSPNGSSVLLAGFNDCVPSCSQRGFIWRKTSGLLELVPPGASASQVNSISDDSSKIGGNFPSGAGDRGFVWSPSDGFQILDPVSGDGHTFVQTVSANGTRVIGGSCPEDYSLCRAMIWTLGGSSGDDDDDDGIADAVDTDPDTPSDSFDDGSGTSGVLTDRAGLTVTITDADSPDGVRVEVGAGSGQITIDACGFMETIDAGSEATITCGSVTLSVIQGAGEVVIDDGRLTVVSVTAGATASVTDNGDGTVLVQNVGSVGDVSVAVDGDETTLSPGDSQTHTVVYEFDGFFSPVDNLPTLNSAKAGSAIPVKFGLGGNHGLGIFAAGYPTSQQVTCDTSAPLDIVEETVSASSSGLSYDANADQYRYVWKTDKAWFGTCRRLTIGLDDATYHVATFKFK